MQIGFLSPRAAPFAMELSSRGLEQAAIERDQVTADALARELALDEFAAGLAKLAAQLRIQCEPLDGVGERLGVLKRHHKRVEVCTRNVAASRDISGNQRAAAGRSLQQAQRQSLTMGRKDRDMRARPERTDIFYEAEMFDVGPAGPSFDLLQRGRGRGGGIRQARDDELDLAAALDEALVCDQKRAYALRSHQAADE